MTKQEWIVKICDSYEDGTGKELASILENHSVNDVNIIENAWSEINSYISFCMDVYVHYWHKDKQKYVSVYSTKNINELDFNNWEITHINDRKKFYPDSEPEHPYFKLCLKMFKDENGRRYGEKYGHLFTKLLGGHTFKEN